MHTQVVMLHRMGLFTSQMVGGEVAQPPVLYTLPCYGLLLFRY